MTATPNDEERDPETDDSELEDEDEDDDELGPPLCVIAKVGDLPISHFPPELARKWADRPVWFHHEDDGELVTLFDRHPEDPMPSGTAKALLAGLRRYAEERSEALQEVLGPTDGIAYGFHVDARLSAVIASFEEDGFVVVGTIRDGEVQETVDESEGGADR